MPLPASGGRLASSCPLTGCGGDLTGRWKLAVECFAPGTNGEFQAAQQTFSSFQTQCAGVTAEAVAELTGTVTFEASKAYQVTFGSLTVSSQISLPKRCLKDSTKACDGLEGFTDLGDRCELRASESQTPENETGTYQVQGNDVQFTPPAPGEPTRWTQLCVQGDVARAVMTERSGESYVLRLTREGT
jgi:hypothetical protein